MRYECRCPVVSSKVSITVGIGPGFACAADAVSPSFDPNGTELAPVAASVEVGGALEPGMFKCKPPPAALLDSMDWSVGMDNASTCRSACWSATGACSRLEPATSPVVIVGMVDPLFFLAEGSRSIISSEVVAGIASLFCDLDPEAAPFRDGSPSIAPDGLLDDI